MTKFDIIPDNETEALISRLVKKYINYNVINVILVRSDKSIYRVICKEGIIRVDLARRYLRGVDEQIIAYNEGVNVPKILYVSFNSGKKSVCKISEWIDGILLLNIKEEDRVEVFTKFASAVAKLNSITKNGQVLVCSDMNLGNMVWTPDRQVYFIDVEELMFEPNVNSNITKLLLKRIKNRKMIDVFLSEYSKYINIDNIVLKCERSEWTWKK